MQLNIADAEVVQLIAQTARRTGLTKREVVRQGLRKGVPQVVEGAQFRRRPSLLERLCALKGLEIPARHCPLRRRL